MTEEETKKRIRDAVAAERERIALACQEMRLKKQKDEYDKGWNDALDSLASALRTYRNTP